MSIKNIMRDVIYKVIDEDFNWIMYKTAKRNIYYLKNDSSDFVMEREYFEYLEFNSLPYSVVLYDTTKKQYFFLDFSKGHNWVKSCFENCDKERLHLGKQVLNYKMSEERLASKLEKITR